MRYFFPILLVLLTCSVLIAGCTSPSVSPQVVPAGPQAPVQTPVQAATTMPTGPVRSVDIIQRSFDPDIITISPGTTVVWTNRDTINHRVVYMIDPLHPSEKELFHSDLLSPGESFSFTFYNTGEYSYADPQMGSGRHPKVIVK